MPKKPLTDGKSHRAKSPLRSKSNPSPIPRKRIGSSSAAVSNPRISSDLERTLFRSLMDNTTDRIYFKDSQSRFLLNNRAQEDLFGLKTPAEAIGKTDLNFFSEAYARKAYAEEQRIIESGKPIVGSEDRVVWPDGRETWISSS